MVNLYITTPIYYVNDIPHIGHAYTSIVCDVMARFSTLSGEKIKFVTGTDEHGQKVEQSAIKQGILPQQFVDKTSQSFIKLADMLHLRNNDFIRTTELRHIKSAQELWRRIQGNGYIYEGNYEGWYSVRDEAFYQEKELVDGKAPSGANVEWVREPSYFFKLSEFQDRLLAFYNQHENFIFPISRRNEVISFVKSDLKDLSISRTGFKWGITVPDSKQHVMYVWLDALANYLTAVGFPDTLNDDYRNYWQDGTAIHVIGKDILRFHAVYWPAFLMAANLPLPTQLVVHGWWMKDGQKMSKSVGNVVDPIKLIAKFGLDSVRYFLLREISLGNDGNFSESAVINRINSELANNIGNLIYRTTSMVQKDCKGLIPQSRKEKNELLISTYNSVKNIHSYMRKYQFNEAIGCILKISSMGNEYINTNAPWNLKKVNILEMEYVLYDLLEIIRCIGTLLQPFIPQSAEKILDQLSVSMNNRNIDCVSAEYALNPGENITKPKIIFCKWDIL